MATKHQVIAANRKHPEWTAKMIAESIGACEGYVNATAKRNGLLLAKCPRKPRVPKVDSLRALGRACREVGLTVVSIKALMGN